MVNIKNLQRNWNALGQEDPFWAILSHPKKKGGKWGEKEFYKIGKNDVSQLMNKVDSLKKDMPRINALEFGCGAGRMTQPLCQYFEQCTGIDIAPSMIALASKNNRYGSRCQFLLNETNDLKQFKDNHFDFIMTFIVLQHMIPEYSKNYIKEFLRVLNPGGLLVFQIPSEFNQSEYESISQSTHHFRRIKKWGLSVFGWMKQHFQQNYAEPTVVKEFISQIEMYAVPKQEVLQLLEDNNGKLIEIHEDTWSGKEWFSFTYYVTK